ncbi:hypothetical protein DFH09DRAFT_1096225 [Mycena vulgaris]|nr:hypothetical protein DFH09DRAFT_1096225 [Mycena vulgaris]
MLERQLEVNGYLHDKIDAEEQEELRLVDESTGEEEEEFDFDFDDRDTQSYDELTTPIARCRQSADACSRHQRPHSHSQSSCSSPPRPHLADARSPSRKEATDNENDKTSHASPARSRSRRAGSHSPSPSPARHNEICRDRSRRLETRPASPPSRPPRPASVDSVILSPRLPPRWKSLPPSSPPAHLESEFKDSEDDYETTQAKIQKILDKQAARGRPTPPTVEEEDLEDLEDFKKKAAEARKKQRMSRKPRKATKGKGKATSVDSTNDEEAADGDDELHKAGPVPAAIKECLAAAHESFLAEVAALAKECGKSPNTLHQLVGSVIKTTFKTVCALPEDELNNPDAVYTAIPWLKAWHDKLMTNATLQWRDNGTFKAKMQKGMQPIVQQCHAMYDSFGVHVWGFVIDLDGQASFMFGTTDEFKAVRTEMMNLKRRGGLDSELGPTVVETVVGLMTGDVEEKEGEAARDMFRCVLGNILSHQLEVFGVARGIVEPQKNKKFKMMWGPKLLDFLFKARCRVVNYPPALEDVGRQMGGSFNLKKISLVTYKGFVPAMQKANQQMQEGKEPGEDVMGIVLWDAAEMARSLEDQRDIALVTAVDGRTLLSVKHSMVYDTSVADEVKATAPRGKRGPRAGSRSRLASWPPPHFRSLLFPHALPDSRGQSHCRDGRSQSPRWHDATHLVEYGAPSGSGARGRRDHWDEYADGRRAYSGHRDEYPERPLPPRADFHWPHAEAGPSSHLVEDMVYPPAQGAPLERHYFRRTPSPPARGGAFTKNPLGRSLFPTPRAGSSRAGHSEVHRPREEVRDERSHQTSVKRRREIGDAKGESAIKRQWEENSDATAPLYKCRFNVKAPTLVFYAKGFQRMERNTRADRATIICREGQEYRRQAELFTLDAGILEQQGLAGTDLHNLRSHEICLLAITSANPFKLRNRLHPTNISKSLSQRTSKSKLLEDRSLRSFGGLEHTPRATRWVLGLWEQKCQPPWHMIMGPQGFNPGKEHIISLPLLGLRAALTRYTLYTIGSPSLESKPGECFQYPTNTFHSTSTTTSVVGT